MDVNSEVNVKKEQLSQHDGYSYDIDNSTYTSSTAVSDVDQEDCTSHISTTLDDQTMDTSSNDKDQNFYIDSTQIKEEPESDRLDVNTEGQQELSSVEEPYVCTICVRPFRDINTLNGHVQMCHALSLVQCNCCRESFAFESLLAGHECKKLYPCNICNESFQSAKLLQRHIGIHLSHDPDCGAQIKCDLCDYQTTRRSDMKRHMVTHDASKKKRCTVENCNASFLTTHGLNIHLKGHSGEIKCQLCAKPFKSRQGLLEHEKRCGKSVTGKYICSHCGKDFNREIHMRDHINVKHLEQTPHMCVRCGKAYASKATCKRHTKTCNGTNDTTHNSCEPQTLYGGNHKVHDILGSNVDDQHCLATSLPLKTVSSSSAENDITIECNQSDYQTRRRSDRKHHKQKHEATKKKKCKVENCNALFLTTHDLNNHMKGHLGEILCKSCGKLFKSRQGLFEHEKRCGQSEESRHVCAKCGKSFASKQSWNRHTENCNLKTDETQNSFQHITLDGGDNDCNKQPVSGDCELKTELINSEFGNVNKESSPQDKNPLFTLEALPSYSSPFENRLPSPPPECENLIKCEKCEYKTSRRSDMVRHSVKHDANKRKKCIVENCNATFITKHALKMHLKGHSGELLCNSCGKRFKSIQGLNEHVSRCGKQVERKFMCIFCGKGFNRRIHMEDHINAKHLEEKLHVCSKCSKSFMSKNSLRRHFDSCRGVKDKTKRCRSCTKEFQTAAGLREHTLSQHTSVIQRCSCGKEYKWRPSLVRHQSRTGHAKVKTNVVPDDSDTFMADS